MKQCQSCGMPLESKKAGDCRGTEKDGTKSEMYCSLCYKDGAFVGGDCTVEQMQDIVDKALREQHWVAPLRWMAKSQIPHLARWKKA